MEDIVKAFVLISIENKRFSGAVNFGKPDSLFLFTGRNFFYFFLKGGLKNNKNKKTRISFEIIPSIKFFSLSKAGTK